MPIIEYMLLALLGSASAATPGGTLGGPLTRTLTADAVSQPNGGTEGLLGQATGGCSGSRKLPTTGKKPLEHARSMRHHRRDHRHGKVIGAGSKVSSSTPGTGGVKPNMNAQPRPPRPRRAPSNSNKNSK
jgi:hypothetical protein